MKSRLLFLVLTLLAPSSAFATLCNVRDFGAVGDGLTDDSAAVAATFTCATSGRVTGAVVVFPNGTYRLAQGTAVAGSHLTVHFEGATLLNDYAAGALLSFSGSHLAFTGSVILDQNHRTALLHSAVAFTGSNVVWTAQTEIRRGGQSFAFNAYRPTDFVISNLATSDSLLMFINQPRRLQVSHLRVALVSPVADVLVYLASNQSYDVYDLSLSDIDIDLGGQNVTSAIVIAPNFGLPFFDGVKISNLAVRNNAPYATATVFGDGIDIIRSKNVTVTNATFRDLNVNGINAAGSAMTLANLTAENCGASCVQIHDVTDADHYSIVELENVVVVNGGRNPIAHPDYKYSGAGIALAPYPGTGTLSLVKLHNVVSTGNLQQYGLAITRNVTGVVIDGGSLSGSLKTLLIDDPAGNSTVSFTGPIGTSTGTVLLNNAYWDGTAWARPDPAKPALLMNLDSAGQVSVAGAASGSGAIPFVTRLLLGADGSLQWNGGTAIKKHLSAAFALNLAAPATVPGCVSSTQTVAGAALGDPVTAGLNGALAATQQLTAAVTAAGQVTFRVCQFSGAAADPDGAGKTYRADVWQH